MIAAAAASPNADAAASFRNACARRTRARAHPSEQFYSKIFFLYSSAGLNKSMGCFHDLRKKFHSAPYPCSSLCAKCMVQQRVYVFMQRILRDGWLYIDIGKNTDSYVLNVSGRIVNPVSLLTTEMNE